MTAKPLNDWADDPHTLDANAVAGLLQEVFGSDMTVRDSQCAHCGNQAQIGTFRVYDMHGPGVVLRCSTCSGIVIRIVRLADGSLLVDAEGVTYSNP